MCGEFVAMAPEEMELPDTRREVSSLVIKAYVVSLLLLLSVLVWSVGDAWAQYAHDVFVPAVFVPAYGSHFGLYRSR